VDDPFAPAVEPPADPSRPAWWFAVRDAELLVVPAANDTDGEDGPIAVPLVDDPAAVGLSTVRRQYLGRLGDRDRWSAELAAGAEAPPGWRFVGPRGVHGRLPEAHFGIAGRAAQMVAWDRDHAFCGRCATPTAPVPGERARRCPACGLTSYPRLSPAVIVLIARGEQILMARGRAFPPGFFGIIAGFVEPGESLEEAVRREVREEVGLEIAEPCYFGSQPWPFPHALMVGFTAAYASGEVRLEEAELADADWFTRDTLPRIPPKLSIARRMIDAWADAQGRPIDAP